MGGLEVRPTWRRKHEHGYQRPLRPLEKKKLRRLKHQRCNAVNRRHARIVLLSRGGLSSRAIGKHIDCSPQWVRIVIHRFNDDGIDGISWYPYWQVRNTPRKFTADLREQIGEVAISSPQSLIGMTQWSLPKLRAYLIERRIVPNISIEWLRQFLHRCEDPDCGGQKPRRKLFDRPAVLAGIPGDSASCRSGPAIGRRLCVDELAR